MVFLVFSLASLNAQERYLLPYEPYTPDVIAQGSSFVAVAEGWNALFGNPAGLSRSTGDSFFLISNTGTFLRFKDISTTVDYIRNGDFANFDLFAPPPNKVLNFVTDVVTQNGLGFQQSLGLGVIANGLGLALIMDSQLYGRDQNLVASNLEFLASASLIAGYSHPIVLVAADEPEGEPIVNELGEIPKQKPHWVLHLGGTTRVSHVYWTQYSILNLLQLLSGGSFNFNHSLYTFPTISLNLGVLLEGRNVTFGLSLTDVGGVDLGDRKNDINAVVGGFMLPTSGTKDSFVFVYPTILRAGIGWTPDFGEFAAIIQPKIHFETRIPIKGLQTPSWLTWFRLGGEVKLVNFFSLRAGYNAGNVTAGAGFRFFDVWEINASFSTEEFGQYLGDKRLSRLNFETSLKF